MNGLLVLYTLNGQYIKDSYYIPDDFTGIIEYTNKTKIWYSNGRIHRLDGPAVEYSLGYYDYWINGKYIYDIEQYNLIRDIMKLKGLL